MKIKAFLLEERELALYVCSAPGPTGIPLWIPRSVVPSLGRRGHPVAGKPREVHLQIDPWWCSQPANAGKLSQFTEL